MHYAVYKYGLNFLKLPISDYFNVKPSFIVLSDNNASKPDLSELDVLKRIQQNQMNREVRERQVGEIRDERQERQENERRGGDDLPSSSPSPFIVKLYSI